MPNKVVMYGIANCDTVKKARKWLQANDVAYEFHDYKKLGIDKASLKNWSEELGWENLLNKRGTTWRKLADTDKDNLTQARAISIMIDNTSVIKRPVVSCNDALLLGFDEAAYSTMFDGSKSG